MLSPNFQEENDSILSPKLKPLESEEDTDIYLPERKEHITIKNALKKKHGVCVCVCVCVCPVMSYYFLPHGL